jgi:hypothetical protein
VIVITACQIVDMHPAARCARNWRFDREGFTSLKLEEISETVAVGSDVEIHDDDAVGERDSNVGVGPFPLPPRPDDGWMA